MAVAKSVATTKKLKSIMRYIHLKKKTLKSVMNFLM